MARPLLKQLKLKAFRSFVDEVTLDFPEVGMYLFRGRSGSGKSSLLLAVQYLLGICRYPATALQSWLTEEPMEVQGTIALKDGDLVITRGSKLSATLAGKKITGSAKEVELKIYKALGLPPELVAALTYRGQRQPGLFLSMTDSEKKEFLTTLLDLGKFEKAVEDSQVKVKELEAKVAAGEQYLATVRLDAKFLAENNPPPVLKSKEILEKDLGIARADLVRMESQIVSQKLKIKTRRDTVEGQVRVVESNLTPQLRTMEQKHSEIAEGQCTVVVDTSKLKAAEADLKQAQAFLTEELEKDKKRKLEQMVQADAIYKQLVSLERQVAGIPALKKEVTRMSTEIEQLAKSLCDRCLRPWDEALARKTKLEAEREKTVLTLGALHELEPQIAKLRFEHQTAVNFNEAPAVRELQQICLDIAQAVERERGEINASTREQQAQFQQGLAELSAEIEKFRAHIIRSMEVTRANGLVDLEEDEAVLEALENDVKTSRAAVSGLEAALNRVSMDNAREEERFKVAQERLEKAQAILKDAEDKHAALQKDIAAELDFQRLVGREGFLGSIFDEVLWEISEETNRILAQFPNTAHVTLNFRSESATQKGTIKKSIVPVVSVGGFEAPLQSGLSGGMLTAAELAVDIAVGNVVSRRTGVIPGWIILDESFEGLGPGEKEASMEILRTYAAEKLVLVVDHASEFKEMFTEFIDVECDAGISRIVEAA